MQLLNRSINFLRKFVIAIIVIVATIILVRAFDARSFPDLNIWHHPVIDNEFSVDNADHIKSLEDYLNLETQVFNEMDRKIYNTSASAEGIYLNRYIRGGQVDPENFEQNWNRSYELIPQNIRGGVLMVHGLTDSPYSMRHLADFFSKHGFYVVSLRMPGHGTTPGSLIDVTWKDWMAVTSLGATHIRSKLGQEVPLIIVGYSNGGALAVKYTLDSIAQENLPKPDKLILLSPMIGVTVFSRFTNWHKILSWLPYFEKFRWLEVLPEYDPFKYNSFPKAAGRQTFLLTRVLNNQLIEYANTGKIEQLPPILTFHSLVDATVITSAIVDRLYNRMAVNNSELVLFDVNRLGILDDFLQQNHNSLYKRITEAENIPFTLTIVTNVNEASQQVHSMSKSNQTTFGEVQKLNLAWPSKIFSLSHVAIPFPEDDDLYGSIGPVASNNYINIGTFSPRGERGVLAVPINLLMRLRYNPFYNYIEKRIAESIEN